jgi:hypothetical protein
VLYGLGDPEVGRVVLAAHHAGVAEATAYLDEHLGTRRGRGGHEHVPGRGCFGGVRPPDVQGGGSAVADPPGGRQPDAGPDGRWTALDGRDLYRHRLAADAIYRARYQRELVRTLGWSGRPAATRPRGAHRVADERRGRPMPADQDQPKRADRRERHHHCRDAVVVDAADAAVAEA